jgi:hypothetical protein
MQKSRFRLMQQISCLAVLLAFGTTTAQAQPGGDADPRPPAFFGGSLGLGTFAIDPVPDQCNFPQGESNLSIHGGVRLSRALQIEGLITGHIDLSGNDCTEVVLSESGGADVWVSYRGVPTYPYFSGTTQLVFEPGRPGRLIHPRVLAGAGWMLGARKPFLTAGAGVSVGKGRTHLVLDAVGRWFATKYDIVEETIQRDCTGPCQWSVVGSESIQAEVSERGLIIRVGVHHDIGRN